MAERPALAAKFLWAFARPWRPASETPTQASHPLFAISRIF